MIFTKKGLSHCCRVMVYKGTDVCSKCGEHCKVQDVCSECNGTGYVDELDYSEVNYETGSPPYQSVECDNCNGTGEVDNENRN
jgi:DnaJ-class molecular chaperone